MKKILVLAYQLHYSKGAEYAVAWNYISHMSENNQLTVLFGESQDFQLIGHTEEMDAFIKEHPMKNVRFIPVKPSFEPGTYGYSNYGNYLFYKDYRKWHYDAYKVACELIKEEKFDLVHFLGPIGYREPGYLMQLPLPYIWGPIGGFGGIPIKLVKATSSVSGGLKMVIKKLLNKIQELTDKRVHKALKDSDVVICATTEWYEICNRLVGKRHHSKLFYQPENCIDKVFPLNTNKFSSGKIHLIIISSIDSRKALILVLEAIKMLSGKERESIVLDILGKGPLEDKLKQWSIDNGISDCVNWHGKVDRSVVFKMLNDSHLMMLPSLHDANTTAVWEAFSMGVPVLSLDHCGMHDVLTPEFGIRVQIHSYNQVVNDISKVLVGFINKPEKLKLLAESVAKNRTKYTWEYRKEFFEKIYNIAIEQYSKK